MRNNRNIQSDSVVKIGGPRKVPRSFIDLKNSALPRPSVFSEKHALSKILVRYVKPLDVPAGATGSNAVRATVSSPSSRLRLAIRLAVEPDTGVDATAPTFNRTPTWSITAMSKNPETGREVALNQAYPTSGSANIPDGYELDSAAELLRVDATVQDDNFASSFLPTSNRANLVLICTWEPNVDISDEELHRLYSLCQINYSAPLTLKNNAV